MVIVRTPLRVSFFGGGTDHPSWFRDHGGAVLSTSINKYIYIQMRQLPSIFDFNYRIVWSKVELVKEIHEIEHPVVRAALQHFWNEERGLEMVYNSDLPSRSGLGSSSAFTVSLLQAMWAQKGKLISKRELASLAIRVEQELLKEPVGCQDQVAVAYGGLNRIEFRQNGDYQVFPIPLARSRKEDLESHMMMFFTGFIRSAGAIEEQKMKNLHAKEKTLVAMQEMVPVAEELLMNMNEPITRFGELMNETWRLKRSLSNAVSSNAIDEVYEAAMKAGASGGKLLGAGGGGFFLFIVEPAYQDAVRKALNGVVEVPFCMETEGSRIAMFDPDLIAKQDDVVAPVLSAVA